MTTIQRQLAEFALGVGAFRLVPDAPVRWASGYLMPVYTDNRLLLRYPEGRSIIREGLLETWETAGVGTCHGIAGTASAGIAPALLLAEDRGLDFYYVRGAAKDHGLERRIEGLGPGESLRGRRILLVEDLLSTGGSAAAAAEALGDAGAEVPRCLAIFSYGFAAVAERFASVSGATGPSEIRAVLTLDELLVVGRELGTIDAGGERLLEEWRRDPFSPERRVP